MSHSTLLRLSGLAAVCCAALLVINTARLAEVLPDGTLLRTIAPLASLAGIFALTGIYLWQHRRAGLIAAAVGIAWLGVVVYRGVRPVGTSPALATS